MKTAETINIVCSELGITKAELAKRMDMLETELEAAKRHLAKPINVRELMKKLANILG